MENNDELLSIVFVDQSPFGCNIDVGCDYQERSLSYAFGVDIQEPGPDPDEVFKECCYIHYVFADAGSTSDFKNDYSAFYHQRQVSNESAEFIMIPTSSGTEIPLNDNTYGQYFGFGSVSENVDFKGILIEWKKVLAALGEDGYKIVKRLTIAGITTDIPYITYTLRQYSTALADHTVRLDVVMNGRLIKQGIDFTGLGWKHSLRVPGFFGRREPQYEEDNLINRQYEKRQISMTQTNEFQFQTNLVPHCITDEIWDFMLYANDIYLNDYNLNNHTYNFVKFPVKYASNTGTEYFAQSRKARLNLVFNDKFDNNIKRNFK